MADQIAQAQQTFSVEDMNLTRLSCIYHQVVTGVLVFIFTCGTANRPHNMPLLDYYSSKGININRLQLCNDQERKIAADPQGSLFDITLLYKCLRWGSHGLARENDDKWKKDDKASIESFITIVKKKRNDLAHDRPKYTNNQLINESNELKDNLIKILEFSRQIYPHIPSAHIDQEITDVKDEVTKYLYDEFQPKTFEEYKNQLFFDAQSEFLNGKGLEETLDQYKKCFEDEVRTTNHLVDLSLPVKEVYTSMMLKGKAEYGGYKSIEYEDVLDDKNSRSKTDSITVIEGPAGVGKTTFTKKMVLDFGLKTSTMKHLANHDHLLKAECRDLTVKSFSEMLHHRMPNVSKHFKPGDLVKVMLAQMVLVILDGLDELNEASAQLFEELLWLKKRFGITLVITTRPEKITFIKQKLRSHQLKIRHIQIIGIPTKKRDEMVKKYHCEITKKYYSVTQDIQGLLKYFKETENRLADLWRIPYNLILVTILWMYNFMNVTSINTAPELYREILRLYITKLQERLQSNECTRHLQESELQEKIDVFVYSLARESLIGLINDHINLPHDAYKRLAKVCRHIKIPIEEMISAFLKRVPSVSLVYSFPHKGFQDYLAAYYIWLNITGKVHNVQDTLDSVVIVLIQNKVSQSVMEETVQSLKSKLNKKVGRLDRTKGATYLIHAILEEVPGFSKNDLTKFQNIFICLLGMFYSEKDVVDRHTKLEALILLKDTGIGDRGAWITILNSVKCDEYVASFISKQSKILDGHIQIMDSSVSAYVSLMKALKPPFKDAHKVKVDVNIEEDFTDSHELLQLISSHQMKIETIAMNENNTKNYVAMLKDLQSPLKDAHQVNIDLRLEIGMPEINKLLEQIKVKRFGIRKLELEEKKMTVNDRNRNVYNEAPISLLTTSRGRGETHSLNIEEEETSDASAILRVIARNPIAEYIRLYHDFRYPTSVLAASEGALNSVFRRCPIKHYTGRMTPHLSLPVSIRRLWLSVADTPSYLQLRRFLATNHKLKDLKLTINLNVQFQELDPLPGGRSAPMLFLPDIRTIEDGRKSAEIAKRLKPTNGCMKFYRVYFPRLRLSGEELKKLLSEMNGVNLMFAFVLPTVCRPSSMAVERGLQRCANNAIWPQHLMIEKSQHRSIEWGKPFGAKAGSIFDMDSW